MTESRARTTHMGLCHYSSALPAWSTLSPTPRAQCSSSYPPVFLFSTGPARPPLWTTPCPSHICAWLLMRTDLKTTPSKVTPDRAQWAQLTGRTQPCSGRQLPFSCIPNALATGMLLNDRCSQLEVPWRWQFGREPWEGAGPQGPTFGEVASPWRKRRGGHPGTGLSDHSPFSGHSQWSRSNTDRITFLSFKKVN